jgi:hypothetical protein
MGVRPKLARASEWTLLTYSRVAYGMHDPLCGMKGHAMSFYGELGHVDAFRSADTELMLYGARACRPMVRVAIAIVPRDRASGFGGALRGTWRVSRSLVHAWVPRHHHDLIRP